MALAVGTDFAGLADCVASAAVFPVRFDVDARSVAISSVGLAGQGTRTLGTHMSERAGIETNTAVFVIGRRINAAGAALDLGICAGYLAFALLAQFTTLAANAATTAILLVGGGVGARSRAVGQSRLATQGAGSVGTKLPIGAGFSAASAVVAIALQI